MNERNGEGMRVRMGLVFMGAWIFAGLEREVDAGKD